MMLLAEVFNLILQTNQAVLMIDSYFNLLFVDLFL